MRTLPFALLTTTLAVATLLAMPAAHAKSNALERTQALVDTFKTVKDAAEGATLSAAERTANEAAFKKLDDFFDYATLTSEPFAPHKAKINEAQRAKVQPMFQELIRLVAYPKSGAFLKRAKLGLSAGKQAGDTADVAMSAAVAAEDFQTTVVFRWQDKGGTYRIVDVSFDGASLVKDYKNQFGRIIEKDGADGLIKKMSTRLEQERKKQSA